jgi:hypothetical protein
VPEAQRMSHDGLKHTRDEATELCVYHLRMAAALYQLVPDDNNLSLNAEITRQTSGGLHVVDALPALEWASLMWRAYEDMKKGE